MKLFKRRWFAFLLAFVLVIGSTAISVRARLGRKCTEQTEFFYADTAEQQSIASLLRELIGESQRLTAIAVDYGLDAQDMADTADWLDMALRYNRGREAYIYSEYSAFVKAYNTLQRQLHNASLNPHDAELVSSAESAIGDYFAQITALASDYNSRVRSFNRNYGDPLSTFMAALADVDMPEEFA